MVIPETQGFFIDNELTWNFDFDNCQDDTVLLDGDISRALFESLVISSTGFVRDDQTTVTRFAGELNGRTDDFGFWITADMNFSSEASSDSLSIEEANSQFFPASFSNGNNEITGSFNVRAAWTEDETLAVRSTEDDFEPGENFGEFEIEISSPPGSNSVIINRESSDSELVTITITSASGSTNTFTESWSIWSDNLDFDSVSGF